MPAASGRAASCRVSATWPASAPRGASRCSRPIEEKHEVDLRALDLALRERGARVAYPALERGASPDERTGRMTFHFVDDPKELAERGCGFSEPPPGTPALASDLHERRGGRPRPRAQSGRPAHRIRRRLLRPRARARPHPEGRRHLRLPARERDTRDRWRCRSRLDRDRPPRAPGRAARRALRAVDGGMPSEPPRVADRQRSTRSTCRWPGRAGRCRRARACGYAARSRGSRRPCPGAAGSPAPRTP